MTLKGITPPDTVEPAERSLFATQAVSVLLEYLESCSFRYVEVKVDGYTSKFSAIYTKENNFYDFLFASLQEEALLKSIY